MAGNGALLTEYRKAFAAWQSVCRQLAEVKERASQSRTDEEYIRFQLGQLDEARLEAGEQERLEAEQELLAHTEEIKSAFFKIGALLDADEAGVVPSLREALSAADGVKEYFPEAAAVADRLRSAYIDIKDLADDTNLRKEDIEYDPDRLQWIGERLDLIYSLEQKHRLDSVEALTELRESFRARLNELESFDEQIAELANTEKKTKADLISKADVISEGRHKAAERVAESLTSDLARLGMPNTRLRIDFVRRDEPSSDGLDEVCFMFSANKNAALEPVAQTASGGEISRLMLCIKAMIAGYTALPTIIFDEVDMGVSGDVADKMGDIMQELGKKMQVIAITHLPQIAAKGSEHFFVYKEDNAEATLTQIRRLEDDERLREIARMLSGATLTEAAIANARELIGG
jgi:DNA repair protein RecN (Recombination protein N)